MSSSVDWLNLNVVTKMMIMANLRPIAINILFPVVLKLRKKQKQAFSSV